MRRVHISFILATACWLSATVVSAATFHYNVDQQTLPNGPVKLVQTAPFNLVTGAITDQYTFHFGAQNTGATTQEDVLFLLQFVYDVTSALSFDDPTNTWSGNGHTMDFPGLGEYSMADTDAPTSFLETDLGFTGFLAADRSDEVPFVQIGDILSGATANFDLLVEVNHGFNHYNVVGSFVSLPLPEGGPNTPEPSTFALLGVGAAGLFVMRRRQNRL